jgi:membrane protease YdiL (CAAX protease family)
MFLEPLLLPSPAAARWTTRFTRWDAAMVACLALVASSAALSIWQRLHGSQPVSAPATTWNMLLTFAMTGAVPFLWLVRTRARPLAGALDYLRLRNLRRAAPFGLAVGAGLAILAMLALQAAPAWPPDVSLGEVLFWVILGPLGEEILFRGILQPRIGVIGQALTFAVLHVAAMSPLQGAVVALAGIALGLAARRWGLWASIVAHAAYNLIAIL